LLVGLDGLRLSLAGAQSKLPVVLLHGAVALPAPGQPTTHILKPTITRFRSITENEALMMQLAAAVSLSVATVEPRTAASRPYLLVERYDREVQSANNVRRLHQEDFCQALAILPERNIKPRVDRR
jgi:serine/threonine-protein kinase HipA